MFFTIANNISQITTTNNIMVISTKNHTSTFSPTKSHHISQSGKFSFLFNCIPKSNFPNILEKFYLIIQLI